MNTKNLENYTEQRQYLLMSAELSIFIAIFNKNIVKSLRIKYQKKAFKARLVKEPTKVST